jgi:serine/threonine-protein kinase RsbW|tara:strand:+ start:639 stop:992 length:354 start_codon:yes stop_codon:yes gene_type:complete
MMLLAPLQLGPDESGTVELVLAEALNNIVEHALSRATKHTKIEICGYHDISGLHLTVIDCGAPMPDETAPITKAPNLDVNTDDMPEGGFGWYMIHTLATNVRMHASGRLTIEACSCP